MTAKTDKQPGAQALPADLASVALIDAPLDMNPVIKAKIGSNYWKGTNETLVEIGQTAMSQLGVQCFVLDNMDMSTTVYILGAPTKVLIEMIKRGVAPPKAAGVRITGYILASSPGAPFFALSVPTTTEVAGLDFDFALVVLELLQGDVGLGLEAGVDHHEAVVDADDFSGDDLARTHFGALQGFFKQGGKRFRH